MHTCDSNAVCNNTNGGFECACFLGYEGDGFICESEYLLLYNILGIEKLTTNSSQILMNVRLELTDAMKMLNVLIVREVIAVPANLVSVEMGFYVNVSSYQKIIVHSLNLLCAHIQVSALQCSSFCLMV